MIPRFTRALKRGFHKLISLGNFLGRRVLGIVAVTSLLSFASFCFELALGLGVQIFILHLAAPQVPLPALFVRWDFSFSHFIVLLFGLLVCRGVFESMQEYLAGRAGDHFLIRVRKQILNSTFGDSRVPTDVAMSLFWEKGNRSEASLHRILQALRDGLVAAFLWMGLVYLSPRFTLLVTVILLVAIIPVRALHQRIARAGNTLVNETQDMHRRILMCLRNIVFLRICGSDVQEKKQSDQNLERLMQQHRSFRIQVLLTSPIFQIGAGTLVCAVGLFPEFASNYSTVPLVPYLYLLSRFVERGLKINQNTTYIAYYWPQLREIYRWWSVQTPQSRRPALSEAKTGNNLRTPIGWNLENVSFRYTSSSKFVFRDFNFKISPGESVLVTGSSGTGKSTLLYLLLGELKPSSGQVVALYNGSQHPLTLSRRAFLSQVGYVGPENFVINGTVLDNLKYGLEADVSHKSIESALQIAQCDFVSDLPGGLNFVINDLGEGLSMGQKQRLALARALLRNPKALILDEATSNLDDITAQSLLRALHDAKKRITVISVSHHPRHRKFADRVLDLAPKTARRAA